MKSSKSILLIEDNKSDQFFFAEALREITNASLFGVANNGKEALDKLEKATVLPDLIFMDINMPVMGGIECLGEIINNPRTKNIPVVICSTFTEQTTLLELLGAKAFLEKHCDWHLLQHKVAQLVNLDFDADYKIAHQTFQPVGLAA